MLPIIIVVVMLLVVVEGPFTDTQCSVLSTVPSSFCNYHVILDEIDYNKIGLKQTYAIFIKAKQKNNTVDLTKINISTNVRTVN